MTRKPTAAHSRPKPPQEDKEQESPEHWGDEECADDPPPPDENPEFWGKERPFQVEPVLELGEARFRPWGGLTIKDFRVADKETLLILIGAAFLFFGVFFFGIA